LIEIRAKLARGEITWATRSAAQPREKMYRLFDGSALYLEVTPIT
jgi:hypothetical protein